MGLELHLIPTSMLLVLILTKYYCKFLIKRHVLIENLFVKLRKENHRIRDIRLNAVRDRYSLVS